MHRVNLKVRPLERHELRADKVGSQLADEAVSSGDEEEDDSAEESGTESESRDGKFDHDPAEQT